MTVVRPNSIAGINSITVQTGQALNIHDASGNLIRNITSSSGVSTFSSLHVGSGTTTNTQGISVGTGCSIVSGTVNTLDFYTNNNDRLRIYPGGQVSIRNTNATSFNTGGDDLVIGDGTDGQDAGITLYSHTSDNCSIFFNDTASSGVTGLIQYRHDSDALKINTAGSERLRINSSGQVLIGGTSSVAGWGQANRFQVQGSTWDTSGATIAKLGGNSNSPNLVFTASRGSSVGTVVQNGDRLGYITFTGDDGTDVNSNAAKIYCEVDGSPGSNDLPGRLIFSTTADGADSASERLRISSDGGVALTGHSECSINALGNSSGTVTIDFRTANYISCTLTGTTTFANPTTESVGQSGSIIITQDGTGSRTASWGSQFKWVGGTAPTLTTTAAAVDRIDYLVVAADTIHCVASLDVK